MGKDLITSTRDSIRYEMKQMYGGRNGLHRDSTNFLIEAALTPWGFKVRPILGAVARRSINRQQQINAPNLNADLHQLRALEKLLENQTSETIDDFIVENPTYAPLAKLCIAAQFLRRSCVFPEPHIALECEPIAFETRDFAGKRNWVHLLINIARHGVRTGKVTTQNPLKIITFNYDMILERVLDKQFANTERNYGSYKQYFEILHPHGQFGELSDGMTDLPLLAGEWAKGVHVVNEDTVSDKVRDARVAARDLVENAKELYFAGFSFAGPNCRLLGLSNQRSQQLVYCNYDGNVGVKKSVESYARQPRNIEEAAGSLERPLEMTDWLKAGYLGELPG
jgi:hypothetical protein